MTVRVWKPQAYPVGIGWWRHSYWSRRYFLRLHTIAAMNSPASPKRIEVISRALIQVGGFVLLCRDRKGGYSYLPGGHVEPGEAASDAVARELNEEAGLQEVRVGPCCLITEQRFSQNGKPRHELNLVFHVEHARRDDGTPLWQDNKAGAAASAPIPQVPSREDHIEFIWVEGAAIAEVDVRPLTIRAWLMTGSGGLETPGWISHSE